jgi:hypothetical protein
MAIKERRIRCRACGDRVTVLRGERGPVTAYCDSCRQERARRRGPAWPPCACASATPARRP